MTKRPMPPSSSPSEEKPRGKNKKQSAKPEELGPDKKEINAEKKERAKTQREAPRVESVTTTAQRGNEGPTLEAVNFFLERVVENCGNITAACEESRVGRHWVYTEEKRNEEFAERFREAQQMGLDALEDKARERAGLGVEKGIYYQGELVDTERVYSDTLMCLLLKGGKPEKYKDRTEITGNAANPLAMSVGPTPLVMGFLEGLRDDDKKKGAKP